MNLLLMPPVYQAVRQTLHRIEVAQTQAAPAAEGKPRARPASAAEQQQPQRLQQIT
ncbi:hypothetical protein JK228_25455, partial [Serratia rubidaea]|nr:hypothetical protein [Serratia rubidaea]